MVGAETKAPEKGNGSVSDQNGKNGPYLLLILDFSPYFEEIDGKFN